MGNPNPFYRFQKAWNAGFYPENQIMSDLLSEIRGDLVAWLPGYITGKTITQLYNGVKQFVNQYTLAPYYGSFVFSIQKISGIPNWEYNIFIRNPDLAINDPSQIITINGFFNNGTQLVISGFVDSFTSGSYTGTFEPTLIQEELKVEEALNVVNMNGGAIFPITYSFNPSTNIATSGLARGSNWSIVNNEITRVPAPADPYQNRRIFTLPKLSGDDTYILSVMERIIQASLSDPDWTNSVLGAYYTYFANVPDGWTFSVSSPVFTTYRRAQFSFTHISGRKFILLGRLDTTWLWQRFVSDDLTSAYNFIANYVETDPLPYEPNQAGRWVYGNNTFDFEFVEFTSGCYESPEFYPMPAKPGDQFQFNVVDGNLTGVDSALVGLFEEDGTFIQQIGTAIRPTYCTCNYSWSYTYNEGQFDDLRTTINGNIVTPPQIYYNGFYLFYLGDLAYELSEITPDNYLTNTEELINYLTGMSNGQFVVTATIGEENSVTVTITLINPILCVEVPFLVSFQTGVLPDPGPSETGQYTQSSTECCAINEQLQASVTIPPKQGCYRMGMYNEPSTTCDMTFSYVLDGGGPSEDWFQSLLDISETLNPYISWSVNGFVYVYTIPYGAPNVTDIVNWCNENIPGMVCTYYGYDITWTWTVNDLPCDASYNMVNCHSDVTGENCFEVLWQTESQLCECGTSNYLYSLSNIIKIDKSDCFSTILEFWSDNNTIAEGYEYLNDWKQRIRIGLNGGGEKPVIEESLYRQSNGVHRRPSNKQDLSIDLHTDFFDLDTQLAMTDATRHPYFVWNGQSVFVKGDLEVATIQDFTNETSYETLSQMKFQVLKQGFQPKNSSCLNC